MSLSGILFFGTLTGLAAASLLKDFAFHKILGWIVISSIGAFEGEVLAIFLNQYTTPTENIAPLFIVMGSLFLLSLKLLMRFPIQHQSPPTEAV